VYRVETGEWVVGKELEYARYDHFSIVSQDIVFIMFGIDPNDEKEGVDGIEWVSFKEVSKAGGCWYIPKDMQSEYFKLQRNIGILPDPYSQRIIIFGEKVDDNWYMDEDDELEPKMFTYQHGINGEDVYTGQDYDQKLCFDKQNCPLFFKGIYYIFGEDLKW